MDSRVGSGGSVLNKPLTNLPPQKNKKVRVIKFSPIVISMALPKRKVVTRFGHAVVCGLDARISKRY